MTEEDIIGRRKELEKLLEQTIADANALKGAIQDCEFWLGRIRAKATEPPPQEKAV